MREVIVDSIRVSPASYQRVLILKEKEGERHLAIWIGPGDADAIAIKLDAAELSRPLAHDLLRTVLDTCGGSLKYALVSDLRDDTFYGKIVIQAGDSVAKEIDCRPSDGIALALRAEAPIYVEETVLDQAGFWLDPETGEVITSKKQAPEENPQGPSAFERFIQGEEGGNLNLEGFGRKDKPPSPSC
jgi:bifunctional DNase/RNase